VHVWEGGASLQLQVLTDGSNDREHTSCSENIVWKTSVCQGDGVGEWDWMPFQKDQQARLAKEND